MYCRVPNVCCRETGTPRMSSLVQVPSRSGCPRALRGVFHFGFERLAAFASADPAACAEAEGTEMNVSSTMSAE